MSNIKITSLKQIKWRFDGKKIPNDEEFEKAVKKAIGSLKLDADLAEKFLPARKNPTAKDLKKHLKDNWEIIFNNSSFKTSINV